MKVTIIIVSFNTRQILQSCLQSIFDQNWKHDYKVIVVDNGSTDDSVKMVKDQFLKVKVMINQENIGFAAANNQALQEVNSDYVLLLNSDTVVLSGALDQMIDVAEEKGYGVMSCKLQDKNGNLQPNFGDLPKGIALTNWLSGLDGIFSFLPTFHQNDASFYQGTKEVGWVSGSVMLISRAALESIKGFDAKIFMYAEDTDLCWRAHQSGFAVGWTDQAEIVHLGGASSKDPAYAQWFGEFKGLIYLYRKYYGSLAAVGLQWLIRFFVGLRIIAFEFLGRRDLAQTYGKILQTL